MELENILKFAESRGFTKKEIENKIQEKYGHYIRIRDFIKLENLQELTNILPSKKIAQGGYLEFIITGQIFAIERLKKLTGIKPEIPEEVIQKAYVSFIMEDFLDENKNPNHNHSHRLRGLQKLTGIAPLEEIIQEGYASCMKEGRFNIMKELKDATGVKPKFKPDLSMDALQKKYMDYIECAHLDGLNKLQELTGVKPEFSEDAIQDVYMHYFMEGRHIGPSIPYLKDKIERLQKFTGINPSIDTVQKGYYEFLIERWNYDDFRMLRNLTGIVPHKETIQKIQEEYERRIEERGYEELINFRNGTGIELELSNETVQRMYTNYIREGRFGNITHLQKITKIEPSEEVYETFIEAIL